MLKIENLKKIYGNRALFANFNYVFPEIGFYALLGESGSGKTTLLNVLASFDDQFGGDISYDNKAYKKLNDEEKSEIRLKDFDFIFQNYNLFEDDNVYNNIRVSFDATISMSEEFISKRIEEVMNVVGISGLKKEAVKNLSGGEKQRVAIARSLINTPRVIFCDEPTGSLDEENSKRIFEILKTISKYTLVICVTHDKDLAKRYSDTILEIENGKILEKQNKSMANSDLSIPVLKEEKHNKGLRLRFLLHHVLNKIKLHKFRTAFKAVFMIICFVCCGLSVSLTASLNSSIYSSFSSLIDENSLVLDKKNSLNRVLDYYSASELEVLDIVENYSNDIDYYGENYIFDFENLFPDENQLYTANPGYRKKLGSFNARVFNEFIFVDSIDEIESYPQLEDNLQDDEVILSITFDQMKEVCLNLRIVRNFDELGEYLLRNDFFVSLDLRNDNWSYSDEQLFRVKGVIFDNKNRVYHTNSHFNKTLFEDRMRFPVVYNLNKETNLPWMFRKIFYIHTNAFQDSFLNKIFYDKRFKSYVFDSESDLYRPLTYASSLDANRVYVHKVFGDYVDVEIIEKMKIMKIDFESYYFSSSSGYFNNGNSIISGFSKPAFFSLNIDLNNKVIDAYSKIDISDFMNIGLPENMVDAYAMKSNTNNLRFKVSDDNLNVREIEISGGFAAILDKNIDLLGKNLYCSLMASTSYIGNEMRNKFVTTTLKIKKVYEDDKSVSIYHNSNYSISLFRDLFKVSSFELIPQSIIFTMKQKVTENEVKKLNEIFNGYEFKNPLFEIEKSVNDSTKFLKITLYVFSGLTLISVLILTILLSVISSLEQKREIGLFRILGFNKSQLLKIPLFESIIEVIICFVISTISLIITDFLLSKTLENSLSLSNFSILSPISFGLIVLVSLIIVLIRVGTSNHLTKATNLIECVH